MKLIFRIWLILLLLTEGISVFFYSHTLDQQFIMLGIFISSLVLMVTAVIIFYFIKRKH